MAEKFTWLRQDNIPRRGPALKQGQEHKINDYPSAVVEEWTRTGAALLIAEAEPLPLPLPEPIPIPRPRLRNKKAPEEVTK